MIGSLQVYVIDVGAEEEIGCIVAQRRQRWRWAAGHGRAALTSQQSPMGWGEMGASSSLPANSAACSGQDLEETAGTPLSTDWESGCPGAGRLSSKQTGSSWARSRRWTGRSERDGGDVGEDVLVDAPAAERGGISGRLFSLLQGEGDDVQQQLCQAPASSHLAGLVEYMRERRQVVRQMVCAAGGAVAVA